MTFETGTEMVRWVSGKTVLITGGTGTIGGRVAEKMAQIRAREVRIFSRDEKKQFEMNSRHPSFKYIIGDVRELSAVSDAMRGVDIVVHAAALKQVPSCELFPYEAFKTNVIGSQNVCDAAIANGVEVVVALSTDKAVNPVSAMGISKAMMEKIVCSKHKASERARWELSISRPTNTPPTVFCCVRLGNVMGSRGSVIPLFIEQVKNGEPLTLTVPGMTRYMIKPSQVVDLVRHALTHATGGEIFALNAPACTMIDLATAVFIKYSGDGVGGDHIITGIRPGEKLHEDLVSESEMPRVRFNKDYILVLPEYRRLEAPAKPTTKRFGSDNAVRLSVNDMVHLLGEVECK